MKFFRYILLLSVSLLSACSGSRFIVEKNPSKHNPVDEVAWLKVQKNDFENSRCRITCYEKTGKTYYEIFKPIEGAYDLKTTYLYDEAGNCIMSYGGLMSPERRAFVEQFFEGATKIGIIWESNPKEEK